MNIFRVWMECAIMICTKIQRHLDSLKWKIEFSDTNFSSENLANISTECFSHHQGESKGSVKTSTFYSHALPRICHWMAWRSKVSEDHPSLPVWILNLSTICQFGYSLYYENNNCTRVTSVMAGRGISLLQWIYMPHRLCKLTTCYDGYVHILGSLSAGQLTRGGCTDINRNNSSARGQCCGVTLFTVSSTLTLYSNAWLLLLTALNIFITASSVSVWWCHMHLRHDCQGAVPPQVKFRHKSADFCWRRRLHRILCTDHTQMWSTDKVRIKIRM